MSRRPFIAPKDYQVPRRCNFLVAPVVAVFVLAGCSDTEETEDPPEDPQAVQIAGDLGFDHGTRYGVQTKVAPIGGSAIFVIFHDEEEAPVGNRRPVYGTVSTDGGVTWTTAERLTHEEFVRVEFSAMTTRGDRVVLSLAGCTEEMTHTGIFVLEGTWDGDAIQWQEPQQITPVDAGVDFKFPSVVIDPLGGLHVICRADVEYNSDCDADVDDCLQELRQIFYLEDTASVWSFAQISEQWTSTVPELVVDDEGGSAGAGGRGRLWAAWHNEERPTVPIGCMVDDVSLWTADLDSGEASLDRIPDSWDGEDCQAQVKSAALPSIAVDSSGGLHALWCLASAGNDLDVRYAHREDEDGAWSQVEAISVETVRYGAVLTFGDDDVPVVFASRNGEGSGEVIAFRREQGGWSETVLDHSDGYGFNWVNPSMVPLADGRPAIVFGRETDGEITGAVYFTQGP